MIYQPTKYKTEIQKLKEENIRLQRLLAKAIIQLTIRSQKELDKKKKS